MKFFKYLLMSVLLVSLVACGESNKAIIVPSNESNTTSENPIDFSNAFITKWKTPRAVYVFDEDCNSSTAEDESHCFSELSEEETSIADMSECMDEEVLYCNASGSVISIVAKGGDYNYSIDWGDGTVESNIDGNIEHIYKEENEIIEIKIVGEFAKPSFSADDGLLSVEQWGGIEWTSMKKAFYNTYITFNATDIPNLVHVEDMSQMFYSYAHEECQVYNGEGCLSLLSIPNIDEWYMESITNMNAMFYGRDFNQDISEWDVSNVKDMTNMLIDANFSSDNYNKLLYSWSELNLQQNVRLHINANYTKEGEESKKRIYSSFNWDIQDKGLLEGSSLDSNTTWDDKRQFISKWKSGSDGIVTIPTYGGVDYHYSIEWGDGKTDTNVTGNITHIYAKKGEYVVKILGKFPQIYFNSDCLNSSENAAKILSVEQWGEGKWLSMESAFKGCYKLKIRAKDLPNLSKVENMNSMFSGSNLGYITSSLSDWNVSKVTSMAYMFSAEEKVEEGCYDYANSFDQDISNWNTSSVTNMAGMFLGSKFNQNINKWDVSKVENMSRMFSGFISNDSDEEDIYSNFNQDISSWDVSNVKNMTNILTMSAFSTSNYDKLLNGWSKWVLQNGVEFSVGNIPYSQSAKGSRKYIIENFSWTINDGGIIE